MKKLLLLLTGSFALSAQLSAGIVSFTNQSTFTSQGTIAYNSTFNDFGTGFGFPGDPFTRGGVTYQSANNLTWGSSTSYSTLSDSLIGNNYWTPVLGSIDSSAQYDLFGFDIGISGYNHLVDFSFNTNLGSYSYTGLSIADSNAGNLDFYGFKLDSGEYFTSFNISAEGGYGNLAGLTHVQVGNAGSSSVPDGAETIGLLGMSLAVCAFLRRKLA